MGQTQSPPLMSYKFDLGNSSVGAIGLVARIKATSRLAALKILKDALEAATEVALEGMLGRPEGVEYINVYISPENITEDDIDEEERAT